jgi:uncharacterized protein involved in cysteine biosynthesis
MSKRVGTHLDRYDIDAEVGRGATLACLTDSRATFRITRLATALNYFDYNFIKIHRRFALVRQWLLASPVHCWNRGVISAG